MLISLAGPRVMKLVERVSGLPSGCGRFMRALELNLGVGGGLFLADVVVTGLNVGVTAPRVGVVSAFAPPLSSRCLREDERIGM